MHGNSFQKGSTIIEVVIILTMIGIFTSFVLTFYNPFIEFQKANDAKRKADLAKLKTALEQYYQSQNHYPPSSKNYKIINFSGEEVDWGQEWQPYMDILPKDGYPPRIYAYYSTKDEQAYWLYASLERADKDSQACNKGGACISLTTNNISSHTICGGVCNYAVTSPNVNP